MRNKLSIYCGFISLSFSLITLALFFVKVKASSVVDISTFIGVMGAFIGISEILMLLNLIVNRVKDAFKLLNSFLEKFWSARSE